MIRLVISSLLLSALLCLQANAQQNLPSVGEEEPLTVAEQMPEFPGGASELLKHINKNLRIHKDCFDGKNIQSEVWFKFTVDKTGQVKDVEVPDYCSTLEANQEIVNQVFGNMPRWKPGMHKGKPVAVRYSLPVNLEIRTE